MYDPTQDCAGSDGSPLDRQRLLDLHVSVKPATFFISRARTGTMSSRFTQLELSDGEDRSAAA